mmetsp:Transcript_17696/g.40046  ORF Transcript_17696/g.40046 Transcript_17696/m.40046 type:complete len:210 (-) Transcript_17696:121-750(-)
MLSTQPSQLPAKIERNDTKALLKLQEGMVAPGHRYFMAKLQPRSTVPHHSFCDVVRLKKSTPFFETPSQTGLVQFELLEDVPAAALEALAAEPLALEPLAPAAAAPDALALEAPCSWVTASGSWTLEGRGAAGDSSLAAVAGSGPAAGPRSCWCRGDTRRDSRHRPSSSSAGSAEASSARSPEPAAPGGASAAPAESSSTAASAGALEP